MPNCLPKFWFGSALTMLCTLRPRFVHVTVTPGSMRSTLGVNELSSTSTSTSGYELPSALPRVSMTAALFHHGVDVGGLLLLLLPQAPSNSTADPTSATTVVR